MKFRTQYERVEINTRSGNAYRPDRKGVLDSKGNIIVKEKGTPINQYAYINSFADSCDINVLVARFRAGDQTALNQRAGAYLDISAIPDNFNDVYAMHYQLEQYFNTLPASVRASFDNSVFEFAKNLDNPNIKEVLSLSEDEIKKNLADSSKSIAKKHKENIKEKVIKPIENPAIDIAKDEVESINPEDSGMGSVIDVLKGMKK